MVKNYVFKFILSHTKKTAISLRDFYFCFAYLNPAFRYRYIRGYIMLMPTVLFLFAKKTSKKDKNIYIGRRQKQKNCGIISFCSCEGLTSKSRQVMSLSSAELHCETLRKTLRNIAVKPKGIANFVPLCETNFVRLCG